MATIIPIKLCGNDGGCWWSVVTRGIVYVTDLKVSGVLGTNPVVITMSLGGSQYALMEAAIDYAIASGVIVVASAGNGGAAGMGYPAAYAPVISVASFGWVGEWATATWWRDDVPDPTRAADFYINDFSSRQLAGQDLDVAAPGSWVVGPYQVNSGQTGYYYLGGTSMSSPHVAGIVALMARKYPELMAAEAESILEDTALPIVPGSVTIRDTYPVPGWYTYPWGDYATGAGLVQAAAALTATP